MRIYHLRLLVGLLFVSLFAVLWGVSGIPHPLWMTPPPVQVAYFASGLVVGLTITLGLVASSNRGGPAP